MLSLEESEFDLTDETSSSLITSPIGPHGNFDVFDPSLIGILAKMSLCARHTRKAYHVVFVLGDSLGDSENELSVSVLLCTVLHLDDKLKPPFVLTEHAVLPLNNVLFLLASAWCII